MRTSRGIVGRLIGCLRDAEAAAYRAWLQEQLWSGEIEADGTTLRSWPIRGDRKKHCQVWGLFLRETQQVILYFLPDITTASNAVGPPESFSRIEATGALQHLCQKLRLG